MDNSESAPIQQTPCPSVPNLGYTANHTNFFQSPQVCQSKNLHTVYNTDWDITNYWTKLNRHHNKSKFLPACCYRNQWWQKHTSDLGVGVVVVVLRNSCVASMQEVVTPLIANFGKINDLRLHAFETIILGKKCQWHPFFRILFSLWWVR